MSVARSTNSRRRGRREVLFAISGLALQLAGVAAAAPERKIRGRVLQVTVTLCQLRPRGCAGYLVLETDREGRREQVIVQVPLGVPIRHEDDYVFLATLPGSVVSVVHVIVKGAIVARSIEVADVAGP